MSTSLDDSTFGIAGHLYGSALCQHSQSIPVLIHDIFKIPEDIIVRMTAARVTYELAPNVYYLINLLIN